MFGRNMMLDFDNDPFFSPHQERTSLFNDFFASDPFRDGPLAIRDGAGCCRDGPGRDHPARRHEGEDGQLARKDHHMMMPFHDFNRMFSDAFSGFDRAMRLHEDFDPMKIDDNAHSFHQSAVMSYSKADDGKPKYFQATSSSRNAPGGVRETRKTVRDSEAELDKMALGRHIRDRGHVVERARNTRTGSEDEKQNFINIDQGEADAFNREWRDKAEAPRAARHQLPARQRRPVANADTRQRRPAANADTRRRQTPAIAERPRK